MSRILVDTSAYAAFMRGHSDAKAALQAAEEIVLNPLILGELLAGFRLGRHRKKNEEELRLFVSSPRVSVVDIDSETAHRYALIYEALRAAGSPIPANDLWIAASAMQHGLRLLTTDLHYRRVAQIVVDDFEKI